MARAAAAPNKGNVTTAPANPANALRRDISMRGQAAARAISVCDILQSFLKTYT